MAPINEFLLSPLLRLSLDIQAKGEGGTVTAEEFEQINDKKEGHTNLT